MTITLEERARELELLGFTERQARFLTVVALHSGYCLRRQYAAFSGVACGKNVRDFLDSLVERQMAHRFSLRADRGHIYHVYSRTIYRAIRDEDNRNRRRASAALMARKIMVLDYVLAHRHVDWIAAEVDKVELFADRFGVPRSNLPHRVYTSVLPGDESTVRFFPHKLPLAVVGDPPICNFVHLSSESGTAAFEAFLLAHAELFDQLSSWRVTAIAPSHLASTLSACERAFQRFVGRQSSAVAKRAEELCAYFRLRQTVDAGSLAHLSVPDINQFRTMKDRFNAPDVETLYREWIRRGESALESLIGASPRSRRSVGQLVTDTLLFDYNRFGSLPGIA